MTDFSYTIAKINKLKDKVHEMNQQERDETLEFIIHHQNHIIDRFQGMADRMISLAEEQLEYQQFLENKKELYESFIEDNGLQKRYELYSKTKGVM